MLTELLGRPEFKQLVDDMKIGLTADAMQRDVSDEERAKAVEKYHLLDDLVAQMATKSKDY